MKRANPRLVALAFLIAPIVGRQLAAQSVTGMVERAEFEERIIDAEIQLLTLTGVVVAAGQSDQNGLFTVSAPGPGTYMIVVRKVGFRPASGNLLLQTDRMVEVRVSLTPLAAVLDPVLVVGETAATRGQREFLSRRHLPWNYSVDRNEIDQMRAGTIGEIVLQRAPLATMRCMSVFFDGNLRRTISNTDLIISGYEDIPLDWVYGMEIYLRYEDIPLKYRGGVQSPSRECGAIFIWSIFQTDAVPTTYTLAYGLSGAVERMVFEFTWRAPRFDRYVSTIRLRVGEYDPSVLFGAQEAMDLGFSGKRILYGSAYVGWQGPAPFLPWKEVVFARVGAGGTVYGGESIGQKGDIGFATGASTTFGVGPEVALGARVAHWKVRPWAEVRAGGEYIGEIGFTWLRPMLLVGVEYGGH